MHDPRLQLNRERNLGEVVSDSFAFFTPRLRVFAATVAPAVLLTIIVQLLFYALLPDTSVVESDAATDEEVLQFFKDAIPAFAVLLLSLPLIWVFYQLTTAAAVAIIRGIAAGDDVSAGDALDAAQDRTRDLLLASLRSTAIIFLLAVTIVGIPWAIKRTVQWSLIIQGIMLDGVGHREALQHSADLVRGNWWNTLGRLILSGIVIGIPGQIVSSIISSAIPGVIGIIASSSVSFLTLPYPIIATTLIFANLKTKKAANTTDVAAGL